MFRLPTNNNHSINEKIITSIELVCSFGFRQFGRRTVFSRDGNFLLAWEVGNNRWWGLNALTNAEFYRFNGIGLTDQAIRLSPDGTLFCQYEPYIVNGFGVGRIIVRNALTGEILRYINNPRTGFDDDFGEGDFALSVNNSIIAVGTHEYRSTVNSQILGTVHIMNATTGALITTITDPLGASADSRAFGQQIALSDDGTKVAIGAHLNDSQKGIVRIYNTSSGSLINSITSPNPVNFTRFGFSLDCNADMSVIAIGEPGYSSNIGRVYLFNGSTGSLIQTFSAPLTTPSTAEFGYYVSLSPDGSSLAIHQLFNGLSSPSDSTIWIYRTNSTTPLRRHDTEQFAGYYRHLFSADGSRYIIPNPGANPSVPFNGGCAKAGAVYIYNL